MTFYTIIGLIGVTINLVAYGLVTTGHMKASEARYQVMNIVGTSGLLVSLVAQWNLAVFLLNIAWLAISITSYARIRRQPKGND